MFPNALGNIPKFTVCKTPEVHKRWRGIWTRKGKWSDEAKAQRLVRIRQLHGDTPERWPLGADGKLGFDSTPTTP